MQLRKFILIASLGAMTLAGCTAYRTTMINAQGRTVTCESSWAKDTAHYFECINAAKSQGFREAPYFQTDQSRR
ncbi:MAG TPA: hypothetical protein VK452_07175 [Dissulfurispiraceae bacterium]|nr:hypothetical protein [Dissulfurispiraceae bacterium]